MTDDWTDRDKELWAEMLAQDVPDELKRLRRDEDKRRSVQRWLHKVAAQQRLSDSERESNLECNMRELP